MPSMAWISHHPFQNDRRFNPWQDLACGKPVVLWQHRKPLCDRCLSGEDR